MKLLKSNVSQIWLYLCKVCAVLWCVMYVMYPVVAFAGTEVVETRTMPFEHCLLTIAKVAKDLGVNPHHIVDTNIVRMSRFHTSDGSVLVTCSRPDRKMIINVSD